MTIVSELKKLTKTMTGVDATGNTIDEVLASLNENYHGGDEPSLEVVAEIPVGTMVKPEGKPYYVFVSDEDFPALDEETYYFNSPNNPSDSALYYEGQVLGILWNAKMEEADIIPIDQNKPWNGITIADGKIAVLSDTTDLSNTTVRILKAAAEPSVLPEVTSADNGDVLTVVEGVWAKADAPTELPSVTAADNGDVLTVVEGVWAKAAPSVLPAYDTTEDLGKVLTVTADGLAWVTPT